MRIYTPKKYIGSDQEGVAGVLNIGFLLLPVFLLIVTTRQFVQEDYRMLAVIITGIILALITRSLFLKGRLKESVMMVSVFFTIILIIVCSLGNGIHDIGLIGFPIIIGFSSILLDEKQMIVASILSVSGLAWLVIGDRFDFFEPVEVPPGDTGDFIIAGSMIILGGFVAFSLTTSMKSSLRNVNQEIITSKNDANRLIDQIQQKQEIIIEIHQAVINSLSQLELLIDHQFENKGESTSKRKSLERKILVIKCAHDTLLLDKSPLLLDLVHFTQNLQLKLNKALSLNNTRIVLDSTSCRVGVDQAIYYGILLTEMIHKISQLISSDTEVSISTQDKVAIKIRGIQDVNFVKDEMVMDLLVQQLKGDLAITGENLEVSFKPMESL